MTITLSNLFIKNAILITIFFAACSTRDNSEMICSFENNFISAKIYKENQGAFGETANLLIQNKANKTKEEIILRCEDYQPKIDSINGLDVYISYNQPTKETKIEFDNIVLGESLINKSKLLYRYHFTNNPKRF